MADVPLPSPSHPPSQVGIASAIGASAGLISASLNPTAFLTSVAAVEHIEQVVDALP